MMTERVMVRNPECDHLEGFDLVGFLACGMATGNMTCPICRRTVDAARVIAAPGSQPPAAQGRTDVVQTVADLFGSQLDWFDF
jgi:hypothetical protein